MKFTGLLLEFSVNTQAIGEVLEKSQKLMNHEPNEFDQPFDNDNSFALDNGLDNNVDGNNIADFNANIDGNYNSFDRPWQDNNFAGGNDLGLVREDYHNSFDCESQDWQSHDTSSYDIYADSYQNSSIFTDSSKA